MVTFSYDNQGNRLYTGLPDGGITNWFDPLGRVVESGDSWGARWFGYNNQGLLYAVTNTAGTQSLSIFDDENRPLAVTDANQVTVTNGYDVLGRLTARGYPDGGVEKFGYSPAGLTAYTNQLGFTNFFAYDPAGRRTAATNANWEIIYYSFAPAGDLLALKDGKGQITQWNYDAYGRVTNKVDQGGTVVYRYRYDGDGRMTNRWSAAKGTTNTYTYDGEGNLLHIGYPVTTSVTFGFDPLNRLTNMVDGVGTTAFSYTSGGELFTENGPFGSDTVTNEYTDRLRTTLDLAQPSEYWANEFGYDGAKRLTGVGSPAGAFNYTYDPLRQGLPIAVSLPNTSYITNNYDGNARLLGTRLITSTRTVADAALYGYNAGNQCQAYTNAAGAYVHYAYDNIGQLKVAASSTSTASRGYAYDAAWNLSQITNNGTVSSLTVNSRNELTSYNGTYLYDGNGNPTNLTLTRLSVITNYTYDDENRLASVVAGSNTMTTFLYDGLGRLRQQLQWSYTGQSSSTNGGGGGGSSGLAVVPASAPGGGGGSVGWNPTGGTFYIYDGMRVIQERDTNNNPTVSYTRGIDLSGTLQGAGGIGGLLARSDEYSGGVFSRHDYYHADGQGNITYLADNTQLQAASYAYDPYGNLLSSAGTLATANTYRFSSREFVPSSGLYVYLYRYYNPATERWLNQDPIGEAGGLNLYGFVAENPLNYVDADGLRKNQYPWLPPGTKPLDPPPPPKGNSPTTDPVDTTPTDPVLGSGAAGAMGNGLSLLTTPIDDPNGPGLGATICAALGWHPFAPPAVFGAGQPPFPDHTPPSVPIIRPPYIPDLPLVPLHFPPVIVGGPPHAPISVGCSICPVNGPSVLNPRY